MRGAGGGQLNAHTLQMNNHMLQQVVSGQLLGTGGHGGGAAKSFLTKLGLQPESSSSIKHTQNASMLQKVCFTFALCFVHCSVIEFLSLFVAYSVSF